MTDRSNQLTVTVKMFAVGELGDCFWLTFTNGDQQSNMLIDCGSFRNSEKSKKRLTGIVSYIKKQLKDRRLDVVVGTHQHNDHLSAFVHCEQLFTGLIGETWLSWLDDPKDTLARSITRDQRNLTDTIRQIAAKLPAAPRASASSGASAMSGASASSGASARSGASKDDRVTDILGFYGLSSGHVDGPEIPARGIEALKRLPEKGVRYLRPGEVLPVPGIDASAVRVVVLGPPRNQALLFDKDPKTSETYDPTLTIANINAKRFLAALKHTSDDGRDRSEKQFPFDAAHKLNLAKANKRIRTLYNKEAWRTIERDWLETASRLALFLDSYTNNSSLVLAIELVRSGKTLLFAADAQTGNWLSWFDIDWKDINADFSTESLLHNTVLYKVGHHGSHNATLVKALEAMDHPELVAMIPVDKTDPNITKPNGWKMPAKNLFRRLKEKTGHRVLRMDEGFAKGCDPMKNVTKWKDIPKARWPKIDKRNHFIEYTVVG